MVLRKLPSDEIARRERLALAARVRMGRGALGWSQSELAKHAKVAHRSVVRLEQAEMEVRRATVIAVEAALTRRGLIFEDLPEGGFKIVVPRSLLR